MYDTTNVTTNVAANAATNGKLKVLLTTEGTYPFHQGGVSTWCDILVKGLKNVDYTIYSILMNPFVTQKFTLPDHTTLIKMPLWGTEEPSEHLQGAFSKNYLSKQRTKTKDIEAGFIPLFVELIEEIVTPNKNPQRLAHTMLNLHEYFGEFDYKVSFRSELAWEKYKEIILGHVAASKGEWPRPDIYCLIQSLGWIYRFMNILNTPFPVTDVTHASAAAFCSIPCILAKLKHNTPFLLTEHGIYLREHYLGLGKTQYSSFLNKFLIRLIHSITSLAYTYADQVSPVCRYNTRWETRLDVKPEKIQVIYNGIDHKVFQEAPPPSNRRPTVVTVARIDPLKDMVTLIKSAAVVKAKIPNVRFVVFGSVSVQGYYEECLALRQELELEDTVEFAGHTTNVAAAYTSGDIVALTSISEAFPYSVIEAMMCGRPVISTDVGGITEAVGETGIMVAPRDFDALADGIVKLLSDSELRYTLSQEARERALREFTLDKVLEQHMNSYSRLASGVPFAASEKVVSLAARLAKQRLLAERAYAFTANGMYMDAVRHFKLAMMAAPESLAVSVLVLEAAEAYNQMGMFDKAFLEMEKHKALAQLEHTA
ncbi:MAG: mshA 6 [Paenibacillaceae bacterium]|jgi:glycosyltransferase involved in cell wall biosynthesis|nr:mshA 6 [Paenibacillaceae bacterium]